MGLTMAVALSGGFGTVERGSSISRGSMMNIQVTGE